jgi:hypothetical protein
MHTLTECLVLVAYVLANAAETTSTQQGQATKAKRNCIHRDDECKSNAVKKRKPPDFSSPILQLRTLFSQQVHVPQSQGMSMQQ